MPKFGTKWKKALGLAFLGVNLLAAVLGIISYCAGPTEPEPLSLLGGQLRQQVQDKAAKLMNSATGPPQIEPLSRKVVEAIEDLVPFSEGEDAGFLIEKNVIVFDLRERKLEVSPTFMNIIDPRVSSFVKTTVSQTLVRKTEEADSYVVRSSTSGAELFFSSTKSSPAMRVFAYDPQGPINAREEKGGPISAETNSPSIIQFGMPAKLRYAKFDFSAIPIGEPKMLQFTKTYWNAFQRASQRWAGCSIVVPTDEVRIWLLFPEDTPFVGEPKLWKGLPGEKPTLITKKMPTDRGEHNEWFFWLIENPELHYQYSIEWGE